MHQINRGICQRSSFATPFSGDHTLRIPVPYLNRTLSDGRVVCVSSADGLAEILKPSVMLAVWENVPVVSATFIQAELGRAKPRLNFVWDSLRGSPSLEYYLNAELVSRFTNFDELVQIRILAAYLAYLERLYRKMFPVKNTTVHLEVKGEVIQGDSPRAEKQGCHIHCDQYPFLMSTTLFGCGTITYPDRTGLVPEDNGRFSVVGSAAEPFLVPTGHVAVWRGAPSVMFANEIPENVLPHEGPLTAERRLFGWIAGS